MIAPHEIDQLAHALIRFSDRIDYEHTRMAAYQLRELAAEARVIAETTDDLTEVLRRLLNRFTDDAANIASVLTKVADGG